MDDKTNYRVKLKRESFLSNTFSSFERVIYKFKLIVVGSVNVGKTALLQQFLNRTFNDEYTCTINVDIKVETVVIDDNNIVDLQIWDTCGQEIYRNLTKQYYNNTNGCFLLFDLSNRQSFEELDDWIADIKSYAPKDVIIILVGNKSDIENRKVAFEEASQLAKKYSIDYIETSAKTGVNIRLLFDICCLSLIKKNEDLEESVSMGKKVSLTGLKKEDKLNNKKSKCCF
jgi:small GTP-binding protein